LDTQLCIKRYTPAMTKIFNLISTDVDRPIGDITAKIDHSNLAKDAEQVLDTLTQKEAELQTKDGAWYAMRIAPYRTIENVIDGVVITFVETSSLKESERLKTALKEQKRDEALLRESEERFRAVFEQTSESIVLIDAKTGEFIEFNERTHKDLGYAHEEFKELKIFDFEADESSGGMAEHFKQVLDKGFEVFETKQKTRKGEILSTQISSKAIVIGGKKLIQSIWWRY
jgi:two-component system, chemotaxis family, CheB/CheR fusion protein